MIKLIPRAEFRDRLHIGRTTEFHLRKSDPRFPKPVLVGARELLVEAEADEYIAALMADREPSTKDG